MKKESKFQADLVKEIEKRFPGSMVLKNDPRYCQGIPDLSIFWGKRWGTLECKKSKDSSIRPNQGSYVKKMNDMSFSAFIFPENKEEVLDAMEREFKRSL